MTKHQWNILLLLTLQIIAWTLFPAHWNWIISIASFLFFSIGLSLGITFIQLNYFLKTQNSLKNGKVLLTFDDGPHPEFTPKILSILEKHQIGALFFVIGQRVEQYPEIVKQTIQAGHIVGNHTYTHPNTFALLPQSKVEVEIEQGQQILESITGTYPHLFRTPIGVTNPIIARAIRKKVVQTIGWSIRTRDTQQKVGHPWMKTLISRTQPNDILLFHDTQAITADHLEEFIISVQKRGIEFVSTESLKSIFHA